MKVSKFKEWYNRAVECKDVVNDGGFCSAAYFWMDLTKKQHEKMYSLMLEQGAEPKNGCIYLANGLGVNSPERIEELNKL